MVVGETLNVEPLTVVHVVPLLLLNSYIVEEFVLVYEAVRLVLDPAQIVVVPLNVTEGLAITVTVDVVDGTSEQMAPASRRIARYQVVPTVIFAEMDVVVFAIVFQVVPLSVDDSQRTILPEWPVKLTVALPVEHITADDAEVVPPTAGLTTVIVIAVLVTSLQTPLLQRTRYIVVFWILV